MWNTEQKAKVKRQKAKVGARFARRDSRRLLFTFCLLPFAFLLSGCRMDMQDQPKYKTFRAADTKTFPDGQSARPLVEGTVARGHLKDDALFYTGRPEGASATGGGGQAAAGMRASGEQGGATGATTSGGQGTSAAAGQPLGGAQAAANAANAQSRLGGMDVFPPQVVIDEAALRRGQDRFNNYCSMCHGMTGDADGMIVRRGFQRPPSFHDPGLQEPQASAAHFFNVITAGQGAMPSYASMIPPEDRWKIIAYIRALQLSRRVNAGELSADDRGKLSGGAAGGEHGGEQH
jgi:mono/diheme cytochrome c family protein